MSQLFLNQSLAIQTKHKQPPNGRAKNIYERAPVAFQQPPSSCEGRGCLGPEVSLGKLEKIGR
jgi:hypothetical protein